MDAELQPCDGCGLRVQGGTEGCRALFDELVARDFSDVLYFRVHRLMVDVYALQHPARFCKSAKSLAAHLCGLYSILEADASRAVGDAALRRWLDGKVDLEKPELPSVRGELTIDSVRDTSDPESYARAVDRWARSTWDAYAPLHPLAREWFERTRS
jgi:hypothetical protein